MTKADKIGWGVIGTMMLGVFIALAILSSSYWDSPNEAVADNNECTIWFTHAMYRDQYNSVQCLRCPPLSPGDRVQICVQRDYTVEIPLYNIAGTQFRNRSMQ